MCYKKRYICKMIRAISFIIFLILTNYTYAQIFETNPDLLRTKHWVFGYENWLTFDKDSIFCKSIKFNSYENASTYIDKEGNLKYYFSGDTLFQIGEPLKIIKGHWSACQGSIFLKHSKSDSIFLFSQDETDLNLKNNFYINIIYNDSVLCADKVILNPSTEKLAVVNHNNNKDIIIATHKANSDVFYFFLLKSKGLICCPKIQSIGFDYSLLSNPTYADGGQFKFSCNGEFFGATTFTAGLNEIYKFDKENLSLDSNYVKLNTNYSWGIEFTNKNNNLLIGFNEIFKFNLKRFNFIDINNSKRKLSQSVNSNRGSFQLTSTGDIIVALNNLDKLEAIKGDSDSLYLSNIELKCGKSGRGLPNFNASYFHTPSVDFAYTEDCWGHQYEFEGRDTLKATEWKWFFTKNSFRDSVATKHCNYVFPDTGKWLVSHIAITATRQDTITKTLTILPKFEHNFLGRDTFYCQGETINLTMRVPSDMHCVHWNNKEPNLDEELGAIIDYQHFHTDTLHIDTAGIYTVRITNKTFCQAWDTFRVIEAPLPTKPLISYETGALASTVIAKTYRWFLNGSFLLETEERSYKPISKGYYQLQLFSEYNCPSPLSDSFLVDTLISIEKLEKEELFSIYPNPSDGNITIQAMLNIDYQVAVYDMLGKRILQKPNAKSIFIDQKGSYVVKISTESGVLSRVVMVE
jgi:hypothetical protein